MYDTMTDISDLADLRFEDLAEADLCDLVRRGGGDEGEHCGRSRSAFCSRPSSPPSSSCGSSSSTASSSLMLLLQGREAKAYTHITLINGERICLKEEDEDDEGSGGRDEGEDGRYSPDSHSLDMDLNYVLQAGVVERVAPAFSTVTSTLTAMDLDSTCCSLDFDVELPPPSTASPAVQLTKPRQPPKPQQQSAAARPLFRPAVKGSIVRPRASILASQLPLPVLASTRLLERTQLVATSRQQQQQQQASFVISSAEISSRSASTNNNNNTSQSSSTSSNSINNNTNSASSLLRSALTSKAEAAAAAAEAAAATSAKPRPPPVKTMGGTAARKKSGGERQVEDIFLLSLEGRDAVARLKDGASQLFPNTRVSTEPAKELPNVISIEVDISGNLVLHKTTTTSTGMAPGASSAAAAAADHLAKVRKYQRRSREEPRKECRLLHHCHICNKGFKDKYSVNVHIRTHTGEKPFACQLCGKKFRQKAHLAKHHQTHAARPPGSEGGGGGQPPTLLQLGVEQQQQLQQLQYQLEDLDEEEEEDEVFDDSDIADLDCISAAV
jgi:hypothetical protein